MILKNYFILYNFIFFENSIFKKNYVNYSNFLFNLNNKYLYVILGFNNFKYSWANQNFYENGEFLINYFFLKNTNLNKKTLMNKNHKLDDIILLKKKSSIIKKSIDYNFIYLNKINDNKDFFNKNFYENNYINTDYLYNESLSTKTLDMKSKTKLLFKDNRILIKNFFNLKYYRKFSLSKNLKKLSNMKKIDLVKNFNMNITNIVMSSDFFFSYHDFIWFLKNGLISVNFVITKNKNHILKLYDIINISSLDHYYEFYKIYFSNLVSNIHKINSKFWLINKNKYKNLELKNFNQNYPKWIENYKYFKKDVPLYLEVDYLCMTIIVINYDMSFKNLNYFNFKFINIYLNRLYNWKFII